MGTTLPQKPLYLHSPLSYYSAPSIVAAGYTQRMLPVATSTYSGQRTVQTYMSTVSVMVIAGVWLHDYADTNPRSDMKGAEPYQLYSVYTISFSSPDGDLPYKKGDYFKSSGALVGLTVNTQYPIRGVMPYNSYIELVLERKV